MVATPPAALRIAQLPHTVALMHYRTTHRTDEAVTQLLAAAADPVGGELLKPDRLHVDLQVLRVDGVEWVRLTLQGAWGVVGSRLWTSEYENPRFPELRSFESRNPRIPQF